MLKNIFQVFSMIILLAESALSYNYTLLHDNADSIVDELLRKVPQTINGTVARLDFLNIEEDSGLKEYKGRKIFKEEAVSSLMGGEDQLGGFLAICKRIYHDNKDIDPDVRAAVQLLVETVLKKYGEVLKEYKEVRALLPTYQG